MTLRALAVRYKNTLAALAGVVSAIPGMTALSELELPQEVEHLFPFILTAFSAAAVLLVFTQRGVVARWSNRLVVFAAVGCLALLLVSFVAFEGLVNFVWVTHTWRPEPTRDFIPLFLPHAAQKLIAAAGSRSQLLSTQGPDVLTPFTTETNVALTLAVLIVVYTMMVICLASAFTLLFIRAGAPSDGPQVR
jgi:hypothetical protein